MAFLSKWMGKKETPATIGDVRFEPVLKSRAKEEGAYATWIRNHLWNARNEAWCRRQIDHFTYKPTVGILVQSNNPKVEFLRESLSSIFNQVYGFNELSIVDRGSSDPEVRSLLESIRNDPRVNVSFQKGTERDQQAIAKIMKKTESEWLLLMGAEDILEPNAIYDMIATLQGTVEIDFVFADSDLIDDNGLRFAPQFKPVWAVGAHYPLGYYQHPILLHGRVVQKLHGHERLSALMEEGTLLDEASNHSRYVLQSPGIPYHARARGLKNENPPPAVWNVLINENYVQEANGIDIDSEVRICTQPRVPLKILWLLDSLESGDGELHLYYLMRYFARQFKHQIHIVASVDGAMRSLFEGFAAVTVAKPAPDLVRRLHDEKHFDCAVVTSLNEPQYPDGLSSLDLPATWQIARRTELSAQLQDAFKSPATIVFPSETVARPYRNIDTRGISRLLRTSVDLAEIKLYKQKNSPMDLRTSLNIPRNAVVFAILGSTDERHGQKRFVDAALRLMQKLPEVELDFLIVGEPPGAYVDSLKEAIKRAMKLDRFHFFPASADPASRYPYYWISDVCVTCSDSETFPMTALEAMAFKKPVIGPNVFAVNEVIEHEENGYLFNPEDPSELAYWMEWLATKKDLIDALGRISFEMAMEKFAMKKSALRMERFLRESIVYFLSS